MMKNFNYSYNTLKTAASSLKSQHFQLSGKLESGEGSESEPIYAKLVQLGYTRYQSDWQNFIKVLKCDASQRGDITPDIHILAAKCSRFLL